VCFILLFIYFFNIEDYRDTITPYFVPIWHTAETITVEGLLTITRPLYTDYRDMGWGAVTTYTGYNNYNRMIMIETTVGLYYGSTLDWCDDR